MAHNQYIGFSNWKRTTEPSVGFKKSFLSVTKNVDGQDIIVLRPIQGHTNRDTLLNDVSGCPHNQSHNGKPSRLCGCGFHAYHNMTDAINHTDLQTPIFKTVSSGKIIMYTRGIRAARQRVSEVFMTSCFEQNCPMPADRVLCLQDNGTIWQLCKIHSKRYGAVGEKTFKWLEDAMNASLVNGEPKISVKPLDETTVPWDGYHFVPKSAAASSVQKEPVDRFAGMAIGASLVILASLAVRDAVKTFSS